MKIFLFFFSFFLLFACQPSTNSSKTIKKEIAKLISSPTKIISPPKNRQEILARLKQKVAEGKPLVAHILVPLCVDNK
jgi:hypothetical protein